MEPPLPKPVGDELWVVETPLSLAGVPAGRRMAIVRLGDGGLFVHSPARLTPELRSALDELGRVRFVVAASQIHGHLFMEQYKAAYDDVLLFAPPRLERRRRDLTFDGRLGDEADPRWADAVDQALFRGGTLATEAIFLHRRSRTLIVGDLVWNVTAAMPVRARLWAGWREGVRPAPAFRLATRDRRGARASLERMLGWDFDRILIGHGEVVETGGREALRQAYAGLLRQ